jgi:hypothetical protein
LFNVSLGEARGESLPSESQWLLKEVSWSSFLEIEKRTFQTQDEEGFWEKLLSQKPLLAFVPPSHKI